MALQDLLNLSKDRKKIGLSEERINAIKPQLRQYIAFWREYPDLFVDFLQTGGNPEVDMKFKFYFYQRVFLRAAMRYKYVYMVFPRASIGANKFFTNCGKIWTNFSNCGNSKFIIMNKKIQSKYKN